MSSDEYGAWIALAGVLIAAAQLAVGRTDRRSKRQAEEALHLSELRKELVELGPPLGRNGHRTADTAHRELLDAIHREVATSTAVYLMRVGKNRGSYLWGTLWLTYGVLAAASVFSSKNGRWPLGELIAASTASLSAFLATLILVSTPLFLAAYGVRLILTRLRTRSARRAAGVRDDVSIETALEIRKGFTELLRRWPGVASVRKP